MVFYFYFLSRLSYFVHNTQYQIQDCNNIKEANNVPSEQT